MSRIRKEPNGYWSKEEKLRIINQVLIQERSARQVAKEENISAGMLCNLIKKYCEQGETAFHRKIVIQFFCGQIKTRTLKCHK